MAFLELRELVFEEIKGFSQSLGEVLKFHVDFTLVHLFQRSLEFGDFVIDNFPDMGEFLFDLIGKSDRISFGFLLLFFFEDKDTFLNFSQFVLDIDLC